MSRITEQELILPALYLMSKKSDISTSELITSLTEIFKPIGVDAAILQGRRDTKFSQIVRNLVAHKTLIGPGWVIYEHRGNNGYFTLTKKGADFLKSNNASIEYLLNNNDIPYTDLVSGVAEVQRAASHSRKLIHYDENAVVTEGKRRTATSRVTERSQALREAALSHYTVDGHILCRACGFDFLAVYGNLGRGFIEIHHNKPLFQFEDEDRVTFMREAVNQVTPLCPNCHRMVHRNRGRVLDVDELIMIIDYPDQR